MSVLEDICHASLLHLFFTLQTALEGRFERRRERWVANSDAA